MKHLTLLFGMLAMACAAFCQELYVNTEPASNMATGSLGLRLENQGYFNPGLKTRTSFEAMYGASRYLMLHASVYASNFYQQNQHFEGGSLYGKYRFISVDSVQQHFRGAFFTKLSAINNPVANQEITLEGDNSGLQSGFIFTRLKHKLAFSASVSYLYDWNNANDQNIPVAFAKNAIAWSFSTGYLLLPKEYKSYNQVTVNVYAEFLGKTNPGYGQSYLDAAPAVQFIFNSLIRLDLSYRLPLYNSMERNTAHMYLIRLEYNLFNL